MAVWAAGGDTTVGKSHWPRCSSVGHSQQPMRVGDGVSFPAGRKGLCHSACHVQHSLWAELRAWGQERHLSVPAQPWPPWQWGNPLHRVPGDSQVKGRMGPFTRRLIYPLSPTPLPSPPVVLLGHKSASCSSATRRDQPLTPALSLIGEGGPAPSPSPGVRQGHGLVGTGAPRCFISLRTAGTMLPVGCPLPRGCHPEPTVGRQGGMGTAVRWSLGWERGVMLGWMGLPLLGGCSTEAPGHAGRQGPLAGGAGKALDEVREA